TLAISVLQAIPNINFKIFASDINTQVLQTAKQGLYPMDRIDGIPKLILKEYFWKGIEEYSGMMLVDKKVRQHITFGQVNLLDPPSELSGYDIIFMRNVLIYFDDKTKSHVVGQALKRLKSNGLLFV